MKRRFFFMEILTMCIVLTGCGNGKTTENIPDNSQLETSQITANSSAEQPVNQSEAHLETSEVPPDNESTPNDSQLETTQIIANSSAGKSGSASKTNLTTTKVQPHSEVLDELLNAYTEAWEELGKPNKFFTSDETFYGQMIHDTSNFQEIMNRLAEKNEIFRDMQFIIDCQYGDEIVFYAKDWDSKYVRVGGDKINSHIKTLGDVRDSYLLSQSNSSSKALYDAVNTVMIDMDSTGMNVPKGLFTKADIPEEFKEKIKIYYEGIDKLENFAFYIEDSATNVYVLNNGFVGSYPEIITFENQITFEKAVKSLGK